MSCGGGSRRYRAVLAGAATGLLIHFVRDIAEGPPGVRMLWPLQDTAWTASFWWFWAMIIVFMVVRLTLATLGIPRTAIRLSQERAFGQPVPRTLPRITGPGAGHPRDRSCRRWVALSVGLAITREIAGRLPRRANSAGRRPRTGPGRRTIKFPERT